MPGRKVPLITGEIYHIFNRGINKNPTFLIKRDYQRASKAINFYKFNTPPIRLSKFLSLIQKKQLDILEVMNQNGLSVEILAYCFMPNHFHFLIKQIQDGGIQKFISNFQNSYTRYFNVKHKRDGSLFLDQFKAVRIEKDEQLLHISRYIHLNPYSGFLVNNLDDLYNYPWSSLKEYLNKEIRVVEQSMLMGMFKNVNQYKKFVSDQADYQRILKEIEHLTFE